MRKKVTVVGAGHVGATCALRLVDKELADVVLVIPASMRSATAFRRHDVPVPGLERGGGSH